MDSYPKEILEGVSPLIFTVDAVLNKQQQYQNANHDQTGTELPQSVFDLFYNSIASQKSIKDRLASTPKNNNVSSPSSSIQSDASPSPPASKFQSFRYNFRSFAINSNSSAFSSSKKVLASSTKKDFFSHACIVPVSNRHAFPPSKDPMGNQNQNISLNNKLYKAISTSLLKRNATTNATPSPSNTTDFNSSADDYNTTSNHNVTSTKGTSSYDNLSAEKRRSVYNVLSSNPIQGILPAGWIEKHVHALPSTLLFVTELDAHNKSNSSNNSTDNNSTLYDQALLEQHLLHTMEHITATIAKKRDVPIHLVVLVKVDHEQDLDIIQSGTNSSCVTVTPMTIGGYKNPSLEEKLIIQQERVNSIKSVLRFNSNSITLLHYYIPKDDSTNNNNDKNNTSSPTNETQHKNKIKFNKQQFLKLQQNIYENSNLYYLTQVRRFKRKHALLHHDKIYDLLPIAIRYCIKIAIFYEFQCCSLNSSNTIGSTSSGGRDGEKSISNRTLEEEKVKREKSNKYWREAYSNIIDYYVFLIQKEMESRGKDHRGMTSNGDNSNEILYRRYKEMTNSIQEAVSSPASKLSLPPPPPPLVSTPVQNGVEVALSGRGGVTIDAKTPNKVPNNNLEIDELKMTKLTHSEDMIHQCRAVADWLNLKLLLLSHSKTKADMKDNDSNGEMIIQGVVAMANQVRKHSQVFLSKPSTLSYGSYTNDKSSICLMNDPTWYFWQYVAHQKRVLSEFMEHHLHIPLDKVTKLLEPNILGQFSAPKHCIASGESLLQLGLAVKNELVSKEKMSKEDLSVKRNPNEFNNIDSRQRFVGSLAQSELSTLFHEEITRSHTTAALASFLHAKTLMMSDKSTPSLVTNKISTTENLRLHYLIASILMKQEKFNEAIELLQFTLTQSRDFHSLYDLLERMLIKCYNKVAGIDADENKKLLNASLSLLLMNGTRSLITNAILKSLLSDPSPDASFAADGVIKLPFCPDDEQPLNFTLTFPNHSYAIEGDVVDSLLQLRSNLNIPVQVKVISIQPNLNQVRLEFHKEMEFLMKPNESKELLVKATIPNNLDKVVDAKLVQMQSLKGERSRSCGLTQPGGGVFSCKKEQKKLQGGLCIGCVAIQVELSVPNHNTKIKMKIINTHRGTVPLPNMLRSSTEEDNYIYSAWSRPSCFAIAKGPRCLRALKPQPDLEIIDLTTPITNGTALEGTVNRILLQLKSKSNEYCRNLRMSITCENSYEHVRSTSDSLLDKDQDEIVLDTEPLRPPVLVQYNHDDKPNTIISNNIPRGWDLLKDDWAYVTDSMVGGGSIHTFFDLFRPSAEYEESEQVVLCNTEFCVKVSYIQVRPNHCESSSGDLVTQEYRGTIRWSPPIKTNISFSSALKKVLPCGSRHHANRISCNSSINDLEVVKSGGEALLHCSIEANEANNKLPVILSNVKFEADRENLNNHCDVQLISVRSNTSTQRDVLLSTKDNYLCKKLNAGTRVDISFAVRPTIMNDKLPMGAEMKTCRLGVVSIDWSPVPFMIPSSIVLKLKDKFHDYHGPLPMTPPRLLKQRGPTCQVESTPFQASFQTIPALPQVGHPFKIIYEIVNRTSLHQRIRVLMNDTASNNMLVSGIINSEILLAPFEKKILSYFILVTKVGNVTTPAFDVSSERYNSWIVHGSNTIFVSP